MRQAKEIVIKKRYIQILKYVQKKCKVYHRDLSKDGVGGYYNPNNHIISINKKDKYTLDGCFFLLHEYFHYIDHKKGKYKKFYSWWDDEKYADWKMEIIVKAEQSASKQAVKLLEKFRILYISEDLTKTGLKRNKKFWRGFYFRD